MSSGCGDVLSLEDLKTAKKHQLFEAEVITGHSGGVSGGASIDYATNAVTGQVQKTMPAILRDIGFRPASFDFDTGGTLGVDDRDLAVLWPAPGGDADWYYWEGALPKVIPASSTPLTTGGIADGAWRPVGDITLRGNLAASTGATLVGYSSGTVASALDNLYVRNNYVTPEEFGAVGDGVTDDTAAWQSAADAKKNIVCANGVTYVLTSTVVFPDTATLYIDGNGATILWQGGNAQPFDQYTTSPTKLGYTTFKSYYRLKFKGPVLPKSKFSDYASCHALNYAEGFASDLVFDGWTNCFRVFGNTVSSNITADNLRNAVWSSRNSNNRIDNVRVGWCAGDVIVAYGDNFSVTNIVAEYAGVIPSDTLEASGTPRGCLISTGQDGNASTTFDGIVANVSCKYHGAGGLALAGTNITVGGAINIGSVYQTTLLNTINQLGVWIGGTNISVGSWVGGTLNSGLTIQAGSAGCTCGDFAITGTMVGFSPFVLSAFDDSTNSKYTTACAVGDIRMEGFVSTGNAVVISTSGLSVGDIYFRSLGNNTAVRTVLVRGLSKVKSIRGYNPGSSSATGTFVQMSDLSGSPYVGVIEAEGLFGTCVLVDLGCVPRIGDIYLRTLGNGGLSPLVINNSGTGNFFWGDVHINGALGSNPTMNGTLSMTGFYSPIPWTKVTTNTAVVKFPTQVTTTL